MTGWRKGVLWTVAVTSGLTFVGVALLLWLKDLGTAGTVAGLAANVVTLVMTVFAVRGLLLQSTGGVTASGAGSVAAGGGIGRIVTGNNNQLSGPAPAAPSPSGTPSGPVEASGTKSVASGGSIGEAVTGDGNSA